MSLLHKYEKDEILYNKEDLDDDISKEESNKIKIINVLPIVVGSKDKEYVVNSMSLDSHKYEIMTERDINKNYISLYDYNKDIEQLSFNI